MNSVYRKILDHFGTEEEIMNAITTNNTLVYYLLSRLMIAESSTYIEVETRVGRNAADRLLAECLIVFRRQVKYRKSEIRLARNSITVGKSYSDLSEYLKNLLKLVYETSELSPAYLRAVEFGKKLVKGQGFEKFYELKEMVEHTLHGCGCTNHQDKEEVFSESLLVLWKKLQEGEAGIFFPDNSTSPDQCRIYNRKFYQHSKIGTFLAGIARNLFMNLTRNTEYMASRNYTVEIDESREQEPILDEEDNIVLVLFIYYRIFIEPRKLRTTISLLQYDCNLEDKEVQKLTGISNTRIHSSRLRGHFYDWYQQNLANISQFMDASHEYFRKREEKKEKLNEKIITIDFYQKKIIRTIALEMFREEFACMTEFTQFNPVFKQGYYFFSTGKPSALAGLPDEKHLRELMESFKNGLYQIRSIQAILLLLYYGSDEPADSIIRLLKSLRSELKEPDQNTEASSDLAKQLESINLDGESALIRELYTSNKSLYMNLSLQPHFKTLISTHELA